MVPWFSVLVSGFVTVIIFVPNLFSGSPFKLSEFLLICCHHSLSISFLLAQNVISLYCTVSVLVLDQPFLQGTLVPFSRKWFLETEIWILGVLFAVGVLLLPGSHSRQSHGERVCVNIHVHTHIYMCIYFYMYLSLYM